MNIQLFIFKTLLFFLGLYRNSGSRQFLLAALEFIDLVVVFEEDTPLNLIRNLKPDLLVKGGDYDVEAIVGYDDMISWGGLVQTLPFVDGYSTTKIEEQIRSW